MTVGSRHTGVNFAVEVRTLFCIHPATTGPNMNSTTTDGECWFEDSYEYSGEGVATFASPAGDVFGRVTISVESAGKLTCVLESERIDTAEDLPFGWMQFLGGGNVRVEADGIKTFSPSFFGNTCTSLRVTTPLGTFTADPPIWFNYNGGPDTQSSAQVTFRLPRFHFEPVSLGVPLYWVLPITNLVTDFTHKGGAVGAHPLRIWRALPDLDSGTTDVERARSLMNRWANDRVIPFEWRGTPAFIEAVPSYYERKEQLLDGTVDSVITAVIVGELDESTWPISDLEDWPPLDLVTILSLALGTPVHCPWIELRTATGSLARRIHMRVPREEYLSRQEVVRSGLGSLLTCAPHSEHWGTPQLRASTRHLIRSGHHGGPMEDVVDHLARALELLCRVHGFNSSSEFREELSEDAKRRMDDVSALISEAVGKLRAPDSGSERLSQKDEALLTRVADQLDQSLTVGLGFGKAVEALTKHYGLQDADAVTDYYRASVNKRLRRWDQALTRHRATVMHHGYFKADTIEDIYKFALHLRDVLTRLLLKMLGYIGPYEPCVERFAHTERMVGWVQPGTSADALGYRDN
jgi:hypothetical protein